MLLTSVILALSDELDLKSLASCLSVILGGKL